MYGRVDGHERRPGRDHRQRQRQRDDAERQRLAPVDLHGQDVQAQQEQAPQTTAGSRTAKVRLAVCCSDHAADDRTAGPDQVGDQRPLAVVAPVEVARPVPVMGLVRRQVEGTVMGKVGDVQARPRRGSAPPPAGDMPTRANGAMLRLAAATRTFGDLERGRVAAGLSGRRLVIRVPPAGQDGLKHVAYVRHGERHGFASLRVASGRVGLATHPTRSVANCLLCFLPCGIPEGHIAFFRP